MLAAHSFFVLMYVRQYIDYCNLFIRDMRERELERRKREKDVQTQGHRQNRIIVTPFFNLCV